MKESTQGGSAGLSTLAKQLEVLTHAPAGYMRDLEIILQVGSRKSHVSQNLAMLHRVALEENASHTMGLAGQHLLPMHCSQDGSSLYSIWPPPMSPQSLLSEKFQVPFPRKNLVLQGAP